MELNANKEPFTLPIFGERISVKVRPITTASYYAADSAASKRLKRLEQACKDAESADLLELGGDIDFEDEAFKHGIYTSYFIQELAVRHIIEWEGVEENGKPAPVTDQRIRDFVSQDPIGKIFFQELTLRNTTLTLAKKNSGPCANGISDKAPNTAKPAAISKPPVQKESAA